MKRSYIKVRGMGAGLKIPRRKKRNQEAKKCDTEIFKIGTGALQ